MLSFWSGRVETFFRKNAWVGWRRILTRFSKHVLLQKRQRIKFHLCLHEQCYVLFLPEQRSQNLEITLASPLPPIHVFRSLQNHQEEVQRATIAERIHVLQGSNGFRNRTVEIKNISEWLPSIGRLRFDFHQSWSRCKIFQKGLICYNCSTKHLRNRWGRQWLCRHFEVCAAARRIRGPF